MNKALKRIQTCLAGNEPVLDLGNCGLTDDDFRPPGELYLQLKNCKHVTTLILSNKWHNWQTDFSYTHTRNPAYRSVSKLYFLTTRHGWLAPGEYIPFIAKPEHRPTAWPGEPHGNNNLTSFPEVLAELENLKMFVYGGDANKHWSIPSFSPLQGLTRLHTLILDYTRISEPLPALPALEMLSLNNNELTDLFHLPDLKYLKFLDLSQNAIRNLHYLAKFPRLEWLNLAHNKIADMGELRELWFLRHLDVSHNAIQKIRSIGQAISLRGLDISHNDIRLLDDIDRLTRLEYLNASFNRITSADGLSNLRNLACLDLSYNLLAKIPVLKHLDRLVILNLESNRIRYLEDLETLRGLKILNASSNEIVQLTDTAIPPRLDYLNLNHNALSWFNITDPLSNLKQLLVANNQIEKIEVLTAAPQLEIAVLTRNFIVSLTALAKCTRLTQVLIANNGVETLQELRHLDHLIHLRASNNQITDASVLATLPALTSVDLSTNRLQGINGLARLPFLESISLAENRLTDIGSWADLPKLKTINISRNRLKDLSGLAQLDTLEELDVSSNYLSYLPHLELFRSLRKLKANNNQIRELPSIESNETLKTLLVDNNQIEVLPEVVHFRSFATVDISNNPITNAKSLIGFVKKNPDAEFVVRGLHLFITFGSTSMQVDIEYFRMPDEIAARGSLNILNWFIAREQGGFINTEAKCILFGNGEVGKTALSHYLRTDLFYEVNDRTHGILIEKWQIELGDCPEYLEYKIRESFSHYRQYEDRSIVPYPNFCNIYLWDFGGQEYYHATHRLFMSANTLYLLLWQQENNVQNELTGDYPVAYWLDNINHFSPKSTTLIVQNKTGHEVTIDNDNSYKIQKYIKTDELSIKEYRLDMEKLRMAILNQVARLSYIGVFFPQVYHDIKTILQNLDRPYITYAEYEAICHKADTAGLGVMEDSTQTETLLQYLDDIGSVISFRFRSGVRAEIIKDFVFTNPVWLTRVIYDILEKEIYEFDKAHVENVVSRHGLSAELWIEIMQQFELIFEIDTRNGKRYVAPQYLPAKCKNLEAYDLVMATKKISHSFTIQYPVFLPKSNFLRLIARFGSKSVNYLYWKSGFVFFHNDMTVLAECLSEGREKKIRINVQDNHKETAAQIFENILDIDPDPHLEISLDDINYVAIEKIKAKITGGYQEIDSTAAKTLKTEDFKFLFRNQTPTAAMDISTPTERPIKLFVSYSSKDLDLQKLLVKELQNHLNSRQGFRFTFWTDNAIDLGANWQETINSNLQNSDGALILVSANFMSSEFIRKEELSEFLRKKKDENYLILPVLVRTFDITQIEHLSGLQFFKTYYKDYGFTKPINRNQLLPFDKLAEDDKTTDAQLNDYFERLADEVHRSIRNRFAK